MLEKARGVKWKFFSVLSLGDILGHMLEPHKIRIY